MKVELDVLFSDKESELLTEEQRDYIVACGAETFKSMVKEMQNMCNAFCDFAKLPDDIKRELKKRFKDGEEEKANYS